MGIEKTCNAGRASRDARITGGMGLLGVIIEHDVKTFTLTGKFGHQQRIECVCIERSVGHTGDDGWRLN